MPKASKFSPDEGLTIYDLKDNDAVHWADNSILGVKNLFSYMPKTYSQNGATFVVNEDGSVTVDTNDSATTGNAIFIYGYYVPPKGDYIISKQSTDDALVSNVLLQFNERMGETYKRQTNLRNDKSKSVSITYSDYDNFQLCIVVESGQTVNNKTIYPMLRLASDKDDTYTSGAMTNAELTDVAKSLEFKDGQLLYHSDYADYFDWSLAQRRYFKTGQVVELLIGDVKCIQAVTLTAWKQIIYNIPPVAKGGYIGGIFMNVGREVSGMKPVQIDGRNTNPTGTVKYGICPTVDIPVEVNQKLFFHIVYITD